MKENDTQPIQPVDYVEATAYLLELDVAPYRAGVVENFARLRAIALALDTVALPTTVEPV
ncbi:hypothetical protein KR51_00030390 [Rubidibacter lacunae KORDI 51-2]|uniref:DUF4089 domain-containing protein n=1 Tax=Rubidibacter lacunae KORDI 51-2 TaxID=582515 RepID=U5D776_9CHRO|nr:DUF4089 domain-containing protein [Rubidibacter lacunae]ERN40493.1 hypothetical protein KR51_00030390 [Rubidibacter lacunae KORDI 51-2]